MPCASCLLQGPQKLTYRSARCYGPSSASNMCVCIMLCAQGITIYHRPIPRVSVRAPVIAVPMGPPKTEPSDPICNSNGSRLFQPQSNNRTGLRGGIYETFLGGTPCRGNPQGCCRGLHHPSLRRQASSPTHPLRHHPRQEQQRMNHFFVARVAQTSNLSPHAVYPREHPRGLGQSLRTVSPPTLSWPSGRPWRTRHVPLSHSETCRGGNNEGFNAQGGSIE